MGCLSGRESVTRQCRWCAGARVYGEWSVTAVQLRLRIVVTGADYGAGSRRSTDRSRRDHHRSLPARVLELRDVEGSGARAYVLFGGGVDVALYLGSASTFTFGKFSGHAGRALRIGDVLHLSETFAQGPLLRSRSARSTLPLQLTIGRSASSTVRTARRISSPTGYRMFFETSWEVHYNSSRTGVRLIGRSRSGRARWGRRGCIPPTFATTPMPSARSNSPATCRSFSGPDGPSLGGFVCPVVIVRRRTVEDRATAAGDTVRFRSAERVMTPSSGRISSAWSAGLPAIDIFSSNTESRYWIWIYVSVFMNCSPGLNGRSPPGLSISRRAFARCRSITIPARVTRTTLLELLERAEDRCPVSIDLTIPEPHCASAALVG